MVLMIDSGIILLFKNFLQYPKAIYNTVNNTFNVKGGDEKKVLGENEHNFKIEGEIERQERSWRFDRTCQCNHSNSSCVHNRSLHHIKDLRADRAVNIISISDSHAGSSQHNEFHISTACGSDRCSRGRRCDDIHTWWLWCCWWWQAVSKFFPLPALPHITSFSSLHIFASPPSSRSVGTSRVSLLPIFSNFFFSCGPCVPFGPSGPSGERR